MTSWRRVAAGCLAAALTLAACGDDDSANDDSATQAPVDVPDDTSDGEEAPTEEASGALPDPCSLLTTADLAAATSVEFGEGVFNEDLSNDRQSICDWISDDPFATAQVLVGAGGSDFESQRASVEDAFDEPTVDVDLADAAYRTQEGSLVAMRVGSLFVQVSYIPAGPGDVAESTIELAEIVLSGLAG